MRMSEPKIFSKSLTHCRITWERFLRKYIEPDFGLLDRLLSYEILSKVEYLAINAKGSTREKNEAIIKWIFEEHRYPELLDVLKETHQSHLVDYLTRKLQNTFKEKS